MPDFRKIGLDEHLKLVSLLFWARLSPEGVVAEDWFEAQLRDLDRMEGDIDTLSSRLSGVRTLSYIANRGTWLKRVDHWRDVTRDLEERLSDKLHEALMQRFIDARTGALLRALNTDDGIRPEVTRDGQVIIEGHAVGELKGLIFKPGAGESVIADKALRQAANRAVLPLLRDRLRDVAQASSKALSIKGAQILWQGAPVGQIEPGDYFAPKIRLLADIDQPALCERAAKRLTDYVRQTSISRLGGLWKVKQAAEAEATLPQVRAIAFQLFENGGFLRRDEALKLSAEDKAGLKALGVSGHRYAWFLPEALNPKTRDYMRVFGGEGQRRLSARGQLAIGDLPPVNARTLSLLDRIMGAGIWQKGAIYVREADLTQLRMAEAERDRLMGELGFVKMPPQMFPVTAKPVVEAIPPLAEAAGVEAGAMEAAPPGEEMATETVEAAAETPLAAVAEMPQNEERIGWRQKSFEARPPRPRNVRPERKPQADATSHAKPRPPRADGKPGGKSGAHKGTKPQRNPSAPPREPATPYINPYSPFAILREKFGKS